MNTQEMLTAREQLMWDIDGIVEEFSCNNNISEDDMEDVIRVLCDAVCKNFPTNWYSGQPLRSSWRSGTKALVIRPDLCKYTIMNKSQMTQTLQELQDFMFDTMLPANDCVDWYCDRFNVNATDEVIDFVVDAHFAFHGNW